MVLSQLRKKVMMGRRMRKKLMKILEDYIVWISRFKSIFCTYRPTIVWLMDPIIFSREPS